ncbi:MAG: ABC transporter transmembrane domain-containing protein [Pseudomonadales bacterium]
MEPKLSQFIYRYSRAEQLKVLSVTVLVFPLLYLSLELPKTIINEAIEGEGMRQFLGMSFEPISYLLMLCAALLFIVLLNGAFKMRINTFKGIIGERMVRRLRYQLLERVLRFPPSQFQRISQGEIIATVTSETEPLAGFIGDSLAQPLFQGGTMLTILIFMFVQDPILGLVSVSMIPLQAYLIPKMQKKLNRLKKQRVGVVRKFAGQIGESVDGNRDIKLYGTQRYHLAVFSNTLGTLFRIRFDIFKQKFLMKFINNFLNQLPPIMFYAVGGILVIKGQLTIGALVAALTAYKDLVSPWKELLAYYQQYQDSKVRYEYIQEQFAPAGLIQEVARSDDNTPSFNNGISFNNLFLQNERGEYISSNINLQLPRGSLVNIASEQEILLRKLASNIINIESAASGSIQVDGMPIDRIASDHLSRNIVYLSAEPFMIEGTIMQNINYGLRRRPPKQNRALMSPEQLETLREAELSGNSSESIDEVWTDFELAGVEGWLDLRFWLQDIMSAMGTRRLVFEFGLKDYIDPLSIAPIMHDKFSLTKEDLFTNLRGNLATELVERFDIERYSNHLSVVENLAFGLIDPQEEQNALELIVKDPQFVALLKQAKLYKPLRDIGEQLAYSIIQQLDELGPNDQLHANYSLYDVECVRSQLACCIGQPEHLPSCEFLLLMALRIRPNLQGDNWLDDTLKRELLVLRQQIISSPLSVFSEHFEPLRKGRLNRRLSVLENLLWGYEKEPNDETKHRQLVDIVEQALIENEAESLVLIVIGLSQVGIRGERLPQAARQNVQLVRALIKRPQVLILHYALQSKNPQELHRTLSGIRKLMPEMTLIVLNNAPRVHLEGMRYLRLDSQGIHEDKERASHAS